MAFRTSHNMRAYYSADISDFLKQSTNEILGIIHTNDASAETTIQQSNTWEIEVDILKKQLADFTEGRIIFEYTIPRMGKRVDVVLLYKNIAFLLEFKCGDEEYRQSTYDQVYDYALDLRNFQKESHDKLLVPMMISTRAPRYQNILTERDRIIEPIRCNAQNLGIAIEHIANQYEEPSFDYKAWEDSEYLPTPTIVEAAQALYRGHNVHDITRSDAGAENLAQHGADDLALGQAIEHAGQECAEDRASQRNRRDSHGCHADNAHQSCAEQRIPRAKQHRADDIDQVCHLHQNELE